MLNTLPEFWKTARLIVIAFVAIIVSMGDVYATLGYSELHSINPDVYPTQGIYIYFGIAVLIGAGLYIWKEAKKLKEER